MNIYVRYPRCLLFFALAFALAQRASAGDGVWTSGGPWGDAGVLALDVDPSDHARVYAGTYDGGLFRSTDSGATWTYWGLGTSQYVSAIAVSPASSSTLFVGTSEGFVRSTDGGGTWSPIGSGMGSVRAIAFHPSVPTTIYAAADTGVMNSTDSGVTWSTSGPTFATAVAVDPVTTSNVYAGANSSGVFRSTDSGVTWQAINSGLGSWNVAGIAIDAETPATLYAATGAGMYRTTDSGASWAARGSGINPPAMWSVAITPGVPAHLYAGSYGGLYRSTDGGASWLASPGVTAGVQAIAIDPVAPRTVYVGPSSSGVLKSTNAGSSWEAANTGIPHVSVRALIVDPMTPSRLHAGTDRGIRRSTDGGATWSASAIWWLQVSGLALDPSSPSILWAVTNGGLYRTSDSGASWAWMSSAQAYSNMLTVAVDPTNSSTIYLGTNGPLVKSTDGGGTWALSNSGLPFNQHRIVIAPSSSSTVYVVRSVWPCVYKSTDSGATWANIQTFATDYAESIVVDPLDAARVYVGSEYGVFRTTDGGVTWMNVSSGLAGIPTLSLTMGPVRTTLYAGTREGVFRSMNSGDSWAAVGPGVPPFPTTYDLGLDPSGAGTLHAGMFHGVWSYTFAPAPSFYYTLAPCRVFDTRDAAGPLGGPALGPGELRTFAFAGACGIPATATSVVGNVTIVQPAADGDLRLFPGDQFVPLTSAINFRGGQTRANNGTFGLSRDAQQSLSVRNDGGGSVDVVFDVSGFFQ